MIEIQFVDQQAYPENYENSIDFRWSVFKKRKTLLRQT